MRRKCDFGIFRADRMRMGEGQLEIHFQAVSFCCREISKRPTNPLSSLDLEYPDELGVRKEMSHAESFHLGVAKMPIKVLLERADDEKVTKPRSTERGHDAPNSKVEIFCEQETNEK